MSIIDNTINERSEPTKEEKVERAVKRIKVKSTETLYGLIGTYQELTKVVWANPQGLTPQEVLDGLGSDATSLFQLAKVLVTTVNTVQPNTLSANHPNSLTFNEDGTVTVGEPV